MRVIGCGVLRPILRRPVVTFAISALAIIVGFGGALMLARVGLYQVPNSSTSSVAMAFGLYWAVWATLISIFRANSRVLRFLPRLFVLPFSILMIGGAWIRLSSLGTSTQVGGELSHGLAFAVGGALLLALAFTPIRPFVIDDRV